MTWWLPRTPTFFNGRVQFTQGEMLKVLRGMPDNYFDSVCTDPPYHLTSITERFGKDSAAPAQFGKDGAFSRASKGFMGKTWDGGDVAFRVETWAEVLRVLKPGGYILAFSSSRTFGRMSVALEDAGFITHPMIGWIFGSGFPKATRLDPGLMDGWRYGAQSLKPALEPIYMGQKPFSEATGSKNVMRWGVGAVNVDGCRVGTEGGGTHCDNRDENGKCLGHKNAGRSTSGETFHGPETDGIGRWPANLLHDGSDEVIAAFPDSAGQLADVSLDAPSAKTGTVYGKMNRHGEKSADQRYHDRGSTNFAALPGMRRNDSGSAARFFAACPPEEGDKFLYCAKAPSSERAGSKHPTVKPLKLMRYLARLVTPPDGLILDPFAGSGTTGEAAALEGLRAFLIDMSEDTARDLRARESR